MCYTIHMNMDNIMIRQTRLLGTNEVIYSAWRPQSEAGSSNWGSCITFEDHVQYCRIGSDPARADFKHLPRGEERSLAVQLAYQARYEAAYRAILAAHPDLKGTFRDGEITVQVSGA